MDTEEISVVNYRASGRLTWQFSNPLQKGGQELSATIH